MNENKTNESKPIIWFDGRESTRQLPAECIADCSGSGDQTNNVVAWVEKLNLKIDKDDSLCFGNKPFALLLHGMQEKNTPSGEALKLIKRDKKLVSV